MPVILGRTQEGRQEQAPAVRCESESFDGLETFRLLGEEHISHPVTVCGYGTANRGQQLVDRTPIIVESEGCGRDAGSIRRRFAGREADELGSSRPITPPASRDPSRSKQPATGL